jgi:hypothetical protein
MSGVPVTILTLSALVGLLMLPTGAYAQSRVIIKRAYQLERAPEVIRIGQTYDAFAGLYVLYDQCGEELGITPEKKAYVTNKLTQTAREYQIAYQDAYVSYVGASPSQALVDDIAASIKAQQQKAVNDMALSIRKKGCTSERFRKLLKYASKAEALDNAPPPEPTLQEPKLKFRSRSTAQ